MKKSISYILYLLSIIWFLMAVFKIIMAFDGAVDPINGRGPSDFMISGAGQLLLSGAAFYGARRLRAEQIKPPSV
jgi:hypothetical protein